MLELAKEKTREAFDHPNYVYLLIALVALIINGAVSLKFEHSHLFMDISYAIVIFLGPFYSSSNFRSFTFHFILGIVIFSFYYYQVHTSQLGGSLGALFTLTFYYLLLHKLVSYVWKQKLVTLNVVFAAICGYLVLGITAGVVFMFIESSIPNSFSIQDSSKYFEYIYFSFVTLTSIGYGDIVPLDPIAKMSTVLLCIAGQLYITIILALIVGKYISQNIDIE